MLQQRAFANGTCQRAAFTRVNLSVVARESRIGSKPIPIPKGVTVTIKGEHLKVKGPLGELEATFLSQVAFKQADGILNVSKTEDTRMGMAQHGLSRSLANNMVVGVSEGFSKTLVLVGTGYRSTVAGDQLTLNVGYSNPRVMTIPKGISVKVDKTTTLLISGYDKVALGDFVAKVRKNRPPEPYKGKGIRFLGEIIKLKEGKRGK
eukprot:gene9561-12146_t